ncbi:MAG: exo-beta-1,3-glucanase (GH17 family) [Myxococcota bacterium]|jgi:exo-beta-1,3-glucanase (GH17 family)
MPMEGSNLRSEHQGICYSGYRDGQSPDAGIYPSPAQIEQDLAILARQWKWVRLYDSGPHAELVLSAVQRMGLDLEVLLGAWLTAETSNPGCPWGAWFSNEQLAANAVTNSAEIDRAIALAQRYPQIVTSVSAGNEATVDWTGHLVPVNRVIAYVKRMKAAISQPVTFCENHVPWMDKLAPLVAELDFISVHSYPVWEYRSIDDAMRVTDADWRRITEKYPDTPVVITEAGWATRSNGRGIDPSNANVHHQVRYYRELTRWGAERGVRVYVFEAFDEPWKGSADPDEPEKHWGLFTVDRRPKPVMHELFADLRA